LTVEAVIDTGFNRSLSLPSDYIAALGLPFIYMDEVVLANMTTADCSVHEATVLWDGEGRVVEVHAAEGNPLIGAALLSGFDLHISFTPGGSVTLRRANEETNAHG
jgi:clan AA aspartic protease